MAVSFASAGGYGHAFGHGYGHPYGHASPIYGPAVIVKKVIVDAATGETVDAPTPYELGYDIVDDNGDAHGRRESGDALGNKVGSYSINLADGRKRTVSYKADDSGFKAIVRSNEPGTDPSQNPADVSREPLSGAASVASKAIASAKAKAIYSGPHHLPYSGFPHPGYPYPGYGPAYAYKQKYGGYRHGPGYGYGHHVW
ncbi:Cuticle protein 14 isoform a [Nymphon striatum]|nr:Cuticle protein 14 isoform a [Nymphon striatum]